MQVTGAAREGDSSTPAWEPSTDLAQAVAPLSPVSLSSTSLPITERLADVPPSVPRPQQQQPALERESECRLGAPPQPLNQGRGGGVQRAVLALQAHTTVEKQSG